MGCQRCMEVGISLSHDFVEDSQVSAEMESVDVLGEIAE